jgi:hypothetical protein
MDHQLSALDRVDVTSGIDEVGTRCTCDPQSKRQQNKNDALKQGKAEETRKSCQFEDLLRSAFIRFVQQGPLGRE